MNMYHSRKHRNTLKAKNASSSSSISVSYPPALFPLFLSTFLFAATTTRIIPCVEGFTLTKTASSFYTPATTTTTTKQTTNGRNCATIPFMSSNGNNGGGGFEELSSALTILDNQWKIKQESKRKKGSSIFGNEWTKLPLPHDEEKIDGNASSNNSDTTEPTSSKSAAASTTTPFVYLLEPPPASPTPSSVILFLGGAVLGNFPHIAYGELLSRVSSRLNCAVIAAPYEVGLDHFEIAKSTNLLFEKAVLKCQAEKQWNVSVPKMVMGHSLGAKLHLIRLAASTLKTNRNGDGESDDDDDDDDGIMTPNGIGLLSFNNFGLADSIGMARSFARDLNKEQTTNTNAPEENPMLDVIFNIAETAAAGIGIDFTPNPTDTERMIEMKLKNDVELVQKVRLFCFDDDDLDSSSRLMNCLQNENDDGGAGPSVSGLPGTHLAPVYLQLGIDDLDLPNEAREIAQEVAPLQGASFGSEEDLNEAVDEVCDWILGKPPTRPARWQQEEEEKQQQQTDGGNDGGRRLLAGVIDAQVEE